MQENESLVNGQVPAAAVIADVKAVDAACADTSELNAACPGECTNIIIVHLITLFSQARTHAIIFLLQHAAVEKRCVPACWAGNAPGQIVPPTCGRACAIVFTPW